MAFDDPLVWVLIIAVVVFLFGANKIPGLAKAFGQARKEFDQATKGNAANTQQQSSSPPPQSQYQYQQQQPPSMTSAPVAPDTAMEDPLITAAQREGIDTEGKTREQIASELSWKLNRK
jgi:sec-independent protein translocase protein TatA